MSVDILSRVSEVLIESGVMPDKVEHAVEVVRSEYKSNCVYVRSRPSNFDNVVLTAFNETPDTKVIAKKFKLSRSTVYNILKRNKK